MLSGLKSEFLTAVPLLFELCFSILIAMKKLRSIVARFSADDLLRHAGILFSGMMVVNVCNMVFQMAVSRALPKEEYALLAAFFGVLAIIQRPLGTLTTGVNHYSSLLRQEGRVGDVKRLLRKWLLLMGGAGLFLGVVSVIFNEELSRFLHLSRVAPVVIAGALLPALFCSPVLVGVIQGLQCFGWRFFSSISGALVRLGLGAGFVWFLYPACGWAMLGHGLGIYASAGLLFLVLMRLLRGQEKSAEALPSMRFYMLKSFFVQAAYAVLMTADVVMVKHYIPENTEFAYAATLGRMVVFLSGAIASAMFPKVASCGSGSFEQYRVFLKSLGLTALCVAAACAGCFLFSGLLSRILFGMVSASDSLRAMIGWVSLVMGFSALLNVVVQFLLAQRRFFPASSAIIFAGLYVVGVALFHENVWQLISVAGVCNAGALLAGLYFSVRRRQSDSI